jgi:hypothetical protein
MGFISGAFIFLAGVALLLLALTDLLWTTFLEGVPPISRFFRVLGNRRFIGVAGLSAIVATLATWTILVWAGWGLVFSATRSALVDTTTLQPADEWTRFYFAGSTIFTLGPGDYKPNGHFWQMTCSFAAGTGFLMFGTALAYLMAVVPAATQKRQLAVCIWALGRSPDDIIIRAWNGIDSTALNPHFIGLIPMLALMGESHLSYPILHYMHSTKRSASLAASVASLDEALTILECGLQRGCSLDLPSLGAVREAITEFLQTLEPALIKVSLTDPPPPSLKQLKDMGVPVVDDELFSQSLLPLTTRRRLLHTLVRNEGWTWDAVWPAHARDNAEGSLKATS